MLLKLIFFTADTTTVRLMLAVASSFYGGFLCYHLALGTGLFERPAYALMSKAGPEWAWALAFLLHAGLSAWRIVEPRELVKLGFVINSFGLVLWLSSTVCMNIALGALLPTTAAEWTMILASGWALYRTGWNEGVTA